MFFQPDLFKIISYELGCNDCNTLSFDVRASFVAISMLVIAHSKLRQQNHMVFNNKYKIKCKDLKIKQHRDLYSYDHSY